MRQAEELKRDEPLMWSRGRGRDVWAMIQACVQGNLPGVKRLLAKDMDLARSHYHYRTPIYFAVRENHLDVAEYLLDHGADPLSLAVNDPLWVVASDRGYVEMEKLLLEKLESKFNASTAGEPAARAIRERDATKIRSLLKSNPELLHKGDRRGNQPIHWAVMTRQVDLVDELLKCGADVDARRFDGARPLQLVNGDYHYRGWRDVPKETTNTPGDVLDHLRKRGAYMDICTAARIGDLDRVKELLREDGSLANRTTEYVTYYVGSGSPLYNAAAQGHIEMVKLLLGHGADPNLREEEIAPKGHALYSAVYNDHFEIAKLLLEHGAFPNPPVESSADALSIATQKGDKAMVDLLCSYGAWSTPDLLAAYGDLKTAAALFAGNPALADDPEALGNAAGNEGFLRLLLHYAPELPKKRSVAGKNREVTELLFAHGMNANLPTWLGVYPLHEFAERGDIANAGIFLEHGANIDSSDDDLRSTPLGWAAKYGRLEMVKFLLGKGANPKLPGDPAWAAPIEWARRRGHYEIVSLLRNAL